MCALLHRYGLAIAEAAIAPAMPSTTARAGGIFMPIMNSLSLASGSKPGLYRCPHLCKCAHICSNSFRHRKQPEGLQCGT